MRPGPAPLPRRPCPGAPARRPGPGPGPGPGCRVGWGALAAAPPAVPVCGAGALRGGAAAVAAAGAAVGVAGTGWDPVPAVVGQLSVRYIRSTSCVLKPRPS